MTRASFLVAVAAAGFAPILSGQTHSDPGLDKIRSESLNDSQVMENAFYLSDVYGPRFTGSPNLTAAGAWVSERLKSYGLHDVHEENVDIPIDVGGGLTWSGRGWTYDKFTAEMVTPTYSALIGEPAMFSNSTPGVVRGRAMSVALPRPDDPKNITGFETQYHGKLAGKVLFISPLQQVQRPSATDFQRYSPGQIDELKAAKGEIPPIVAARRSVTHQALDPSLRRVLDSQDELFAFLKREQVVAIIQAASGGGGTHFVLSPLGPPDPGVDPPPTIALEPEHYNRVVRLMQHDIPVELALNVHTAFFPVSGPFNVLGDIPGSEKPNEVIVAGAHLDSFQLATGATDNAANAAVVMEAARILEMLRLPMKRTVRFAFWGAEEIDRQGSRDYVRKHILDNRTTSERIQCYFNLDYGSGKIRGLYLQGHASLAGIFQDWLGPFTEVGGSTVSEKVTDGSDQKSFNDAGVLGISFIQDPLDYETRTHHTNMDTYDYLLPEDMKQSAMILATLLYKAANSDQDIAALAATSTSIPAQKR